MLVNNYNNIFVFKSVPKTTGDSNIHNNKVNLKNDLIFDELEIHNNNRNKIHFKDGIKCFFTGVKEEFFNTIKTIINHPIKTAMTISVSSLALMMLPFVGIPTSVAAGVLSFLFAANSLKNAIIHLNSFLKNNKNKNYNCAKENLNEIGKDTFFFALSAPFVPKGIKDIKRFIQYGKISVNNEAIVKVITAPDLKTKFSNLLNTDRRLQESINFKESVHQELLNLSSELDKNSIQKYIMEYDVPRENIPDVALRQWAREHNIETLPDWTYETLKESVRGTSSPKQAKIKINNNKTSSATQGGNIDKNWVELKREFKRGCYEITYKHDVTGQTINEKLSKFIDDEAKLLYKNNSKLSPQAREISTVYHEREHINQFARFYSLEKLLGKMEITQRAKDIYEGMLKDMSSLPPNRQYNYILMKQYKNSGTRASYLMNPKEIDARRAQIRLLKRNDFQMLDSVFNRFNKMKIYKNTSAYISNLLVNIAALTKTSD